MNSPQTQRQSVGYVVDVEVVPTQVPDKKTVIDSRPASTLLRNTLTQLQASKDQSVKQKVIDNFWQAVSKQGTPLIEPIDAQRVRMTFLWRGAKHNVRLIGGPTNDHAWLSRLPDSDIWFQSFDVPKDTRLSYQFAPDIPTIAANTTTDNDRRRQRIALLSTLTSDPFNPLVFPRNALKTNQLGFSSMVELYIDAEQSKPYRALLSNTVQANQTNLTLKPYLTDDDKLSRRVWFYRPSGMQAPQNPVVLYFFDGKKYLDQVGVPALLDQLIAKQLIPPLYAVFIDNPDSKLRNEQLPANPKFAQFIAKELVPWANRELAIQSDSENVLIGSSYGGLASAYIAGYYPNQFKQVISLSGSFWWHPDGKNENAIADFYAKSPQKPIRFFLAAGRFETSRRGELSIIETNQQLAATLKKKNYFVKFNIYSGGHDYLMWQEALVDGLLNIFSNK